MSQEKSNRMKYVKWNDIFSCVVFLLMIPVALIVKIFIHNFWLVGEDKNEARDNGFFFFRYVRENYPKQKVAYVINKKSADYQNVKNLGKVIQWGRLSHWFWYLVAKKNISSQKGCKPNAAACYLFEVKLRLWKNKRYFLQHGVIINNLDWLYYCRCYFKLFCVSARPEYNYVSENFGYPNGIIECTGLARFDGLWGACQKKNQILVMPTWRENLARSHGFVGGKELKKQFIQSEYYKKWAEFLCSNELQLMLAENNYTLLFYPHRNMQCFLSEFELLEIGRNIKIAKPETLSVQQALKESSCLITDYSSVFFDFAYMKKPIVFYQFDEAEFRKTQYEAGYFDYHNNPLGNWAGDLDSCLKLLREQINNDCPINDNIKKFFDVYDNQNCERIYRAILSH